MSWTSEFIEAIAASSRTPVYRLTVHTVHAETGFVSGQSPPGQSLIISSAHGYGESTFAAGHALQIGREIRVSGARITPVSWSVSVGGFSVELSGRIGSFRSRCPRGALVSLEMGFAGWAVSRFQRIAFGRFRLCESEGYGVAVQHTAYFDGLGSILQNRFAENYAQTSLFSGAGGGSTLSSTYTGGTGASLSVVSAADFERQTGGTGVLAITPTGGAGFYVKWTGLAGTTFTISPTSAELFNTARSNAPSGSVVENVIYLYGHPIDILLQILLSGNGTPSTHNVYPDLWGYRLPSWMVDVTESQIWRDALSGYAWEHLVSARQENGWSWLIGLLSVDGIAPVLRQGQIAARYVQRIGAPLVSSGITITESDLVAPWRLVDWDPDQPVEYGSLSVVNRTGHTTSDIEEPTLTYDTQVQSTPVARRRTIDITDRVWDNATGDTMRASITDRHQNFVFRVGEVLTLVCRLRLAQLTLLDVVTVHLPLVYGRCATTLSGYSSQPCVVTAIDVDWSAGRCTVSLHTHDEVA